MPIPVENEPQLSPFPDEAALGITVPATNSIVTGGFGQSTNLGTENFSNPANLADAVQSAQTFAAPEPVSVIGSPIDVANEPVNITPPDGAAIGVPSNDWRVKLKLAKGAKYLYGDPNPGILAPLAKTQGLIFPYTPQIAVQYNANYENYDLTHSNYRGYFYKGSNVIELLVTATFTAQDTKEANYMLAALHFLRSCTKMFYGQDTQRGMPPPLVFLEGLGEYQFKDHPAVITMVNYNMPNDVDYIAAGVPDGANPTDFFATAGVEAGGSIGSNLVGSVISRLTGAGANKGAVPSLASANASNSSGDVNDLTKIYNSKTYVPTKIDINFSMLPIQTRDQVSNEFSLKEYANGSLLKKGFW